MRLFELSEKLYFFFYILQSVEILVSGTVVSDGFTHRPWPRAPHFLGPAQLHPMTIHYELKICETVKRHNFTTYFETIENANVLSRPTVQ